MLSIFSGKRSQGNEAPLSSLFATSEAPPLAPEAVLRPDVPPEPLADHGEGSTMPSDPILRMKDVEMKLPAFVPISKPEAIAASLASGVIAAAPSGSVADAVDCYEAVLAELRARAIAQRDATGRA